MDDLAEKRAVEETITKLFVFTDRREWPAVKALFADRVRFDMTSLAGGSPAEMTPEQIAGAWEAGLKHLQAIHHQAGNFLVTLRGDRADASCYGIASHYLPHPSGRNVRTFVGSYDFGLRKAGSEWRIEAFTFHLKYIDGNPDLEGAGRSG
jgi:hypothetical protein